MNRSIHACMRAGALRWLFIATLICGLAWVVGPVPQAYAATFTVDSTADSPDLTPFDNQCVALNGQCTLRAAIRQANHHLGPDTITLPAGTYTLTQGGTGEDAAATGDLDITDDLILSGAGTGSTVIDGNGAVIGDRVLQIRAAVNVTLSGITIQNGMAPDFNSGGGILIDLGSTLTLTNVTVRNNTTIDDEEAGGGIANSGTLTLTNSTVSNNTSADDAGGIFNGVNGTLTLTNSTVSNNTADSSAGGIQNNGTLTLTKSTVRNNSSNAVWVRFTEGATSTFGLLDADGKPVGTGVPGSEAVLETATGALHLAQSNFTSAGPDSPSVTVTFTVSFKPPAAGRIYAIELLASDDNGNIQGADVVGAWAVGPFLVHLPLVIR